MNENSLGLAFVDAEGRPLIMGQVCSTEALIRS